MSLASFRKSRGLSQMELARQVGLRSKGFISGLENNTRTASLKLALRIQQFSDGQVPARELVSAQDATLLPDNASGTGP